MAPKPGDLILYTVSGRSGWTSKLVAIGQLLVGVGRGTEQYSHVAILSNRPGRQWEWKFPRSGEFRVDRTRAYEVWRIGEPNEYQRQRILDYCAVCRGEWYNLIGLFTDGLLGLPHTAVCSQGAGRAYEFSGIRIGTEGKTFPAPDAIPDAHGAHLIERYCPRRK
jgi:hypothetical protein